MIRAVAKLNNMTLIRPVNRPQTSRIKRRTFAADTHEYKSSDLQALLGAPPKRAVVRSRAVVATNKSDIIKALRRGHRVEDIAQTLAMPIRTFVRRLTELNISARSVRKQYRRSG